ncbi:MAG: hypothetical protein ACOCUY_03920 [Verrucomicrobiota bacterium]
MHQVDLFLLFTKPLESVGVVYMVSGSVASMAYGESRLTNDIDMVLDLNPMHVEALPRLFPESNYYCPPLEVIRVEVQRSQRGHFNIIHHETGHKADIYLRGTDALQTWGLEHRRKINLATDETIWLAPPEYVIVRKLEYYREGGSEKHFTDIRGMLEVSEDIIDMDVVP